MEVVEEMPGNKCNACGFDGQALTQKMKGLEADLRVSERMSETKVDVWKKKYFDLKKKCLEQEIVIKDLTDEAIQLRSKLTDARNKVFDVLDEAFCLPPLPKREPVVIDIDDDAATGGEN